MAFRNAVSVFGTAYGVPVFEVIADVNEAQQKMQKRHLKQERMCSEKNRSASRANSLGNLLIWQLRKVLSIMPVFRMS